MRILYGVCGDGMGHAIRSAVVVRHLVSKGHDVVLLASSRTSARYLEEKTGRAATLIAGSEAIYEAGSLRPAETVAHNLLSAAARGSANLKVFFELASWKPEVVITDFEGWTAYIAARLGAPLLSIDNIHFVSRAEHPPGIELERDRTARTMAKVVVDRIVPRALRYFVLTFARPASVRPATTLHAPILREEIYSRARSSLSKGQHLVAYFNGKADHEANLRAFVEAGAEKELPVVYYGRSTSVPERTGNVLSMPWSESGLLESLASCRGVVCSAGFSFISEALALDKPVLAVPMGGQYEQILNAQYIQRLGFGLRVDALSSADVRHFHDNANRFDLSRYAHTESDLLPALDLELQALSGEGPAWITASERRKALGP